MSRSARITCTHIMGYDIEVYEQTAVPEFGPNPEMLEALNAAVRPLDQAPDLIRITPEELVAAAKKMPHAIMIKITAKTKNGGGILVNLT